MNIFFKIILLTIIFQNNIYPQADGSKTNINQSKTSTKKKSSVSKIDLFFNEKTKKFEGTLVCTGNCSSKLSSSLKKLNKEEANRLKSKKQQS